MISTRAPGRRVEHKPSSISKTEINRNQGSALIDIMQAISGGVDNCGY